MKQSSGPCCRYLCARPLFSYSVSSLYAVTSNHELCGSSFSCHSLRPIDYVCNFLIWTKQGQCHQCTIYRDPDVLSLSHESICGTPPEAFFTRVTSVGCFSVNFGFYTYSIKPRADQVTFSLPSHLYLASSRLRMQSVCFKFCAECCELHLLQDTRINFNYDV
ncbi:hypothetical protein PILCRDRAFT_392655 [Piloderma croceum F 1598]|jgi:hypothetical protein|uniref:Uncharacterized protein n=1 Tax=Piloderma croceum (strain F 1598) TaxID=765440 RepID=A0A0C3BEE3_PILCF|nr:hypothetical protein PILCRDRAFT_392655 [Piloderma croceum F 1598]